MQKVKLDIIHFHYVGFYPPIINLLNIIKTDQKINYKVYTTSPISSSFTLSHDSRIIKILDSYKHNLALVRYFKYAYFNIITLLNLIVRRPQCILYYETISCWPALFYKKHIDKRVKVMVHYHELVGEKELIKESKMIQLLRPMEKKLFPMFEWISQTNTDRGTLFMNDYYKHIKPEVFHIIPNYPPRSWQKFQYPRENIQIKYPIKTVLLGSLSLQGMYLKEYCDWILGQAGKFTFDAFSFNLKEDAIKYIKNLNSDYITLHPPIPYSSVEKTLIKYDIGIILYKATDTNTKFSISNKLYEYHTCGLDVWFPKEQVSSLPLVKKDSYPKIIDLDFKSLEVTSINETISRKNLPFSRLNFNCNEVYEPLITEVKRVKSI